MDFKLEVPTALEYFASLVQSDEQFPLLEAATSLAQDEYLELDIQEVLDLVDQLSSRLKQRLPSDAGALQKLRLLNKFFFEEHGFSGNLNNYYDPDNSYLHVMLRTRRGIPISLLATAEIHRHDRRSVIYGSGHIPNQWVEYHGAGFRH